MNKKMLKEYSFYNIELKSLMEQLKFFKDTKYDTKITSCPGIENEIKNNYLKDSTLNRVIEIENIYDKEINTICNKIEKTFIKKREVEEFLNILEFKEKLIIQLKYFENKTYKEIAKILNCTTRYIQDLHSSILKNIAA